jgi:uncharacterized protein YndB with AHSA1/START domain
MAIVKFTNSLIISAPRHEVFAYLSNLENIPAWNYAIERTFKKTDAKVGVGSVYTQIRTIPNRIEEEVQIVALEPNSLLILEGDFGPLRGTASYQLEAIDTQRTRLTNSFDLHAPGMLDMLGSLAARAIKNAVAKNLQVLKSIIERA